MKDNEIWNKKTSLFRIDWRDTFDKVVKWSRTQWKENSPGWKAYSVLTEEDISKLIQFADTWETKLYEGFSEEISTDKTNLLLDFLSETQDMDKPRSVSTYELDNTEQEMSELIGRYRDFVQHILEKNQLLLDLIHFVDTWEKQLEEAFSEDVCLYLRRLRLKHLLKETEGMDKPLSLSTSDLIRFEEEKGQAIYYVRHFASEELDRTESYIRIVQKYGRTEYKESDLQYKFDYSITKFFLSASHDDKQLIIKAVEAGIPTTDILQEFSKRDQKKRETQQAEILDSIRHGQPEPEPEPTKQTPIEPQKPAAAPELDRTVIIVSELDETYKRLFDE